MPALAIADGLRARHPDWRIVMVGAERGVEKKLLPSRSYPDRLLPFEPIYRRQWWKNVKWPWLAFRIMKEVRRLLAEERPAVVLGTGGYASAPVVWAAARAGIPTAILEQDAFPGLATRWLAPRVRAIFLSVPEAKPHLEPGRDTRVHVTGSPIAPPTPERRETARRRFGLIDQEPVLLVVGGSQGALAINQLIAGWLDRGGPSRLTLLWATGPSTVDQFRRYHAPPRVQVFDFLDPIADAYAVTDLAIARAGMMTIAELCAWGIPSILIPLPTSAADHQSRNAAAMADSGAAIHLPQAGLDPDTLGRTVEDLVRHEDRLKALSLKALARGRPGAGAEIVARLESLASA
jgi:UDP-N-acetylglucosamine--N-acetylmuramyl-(pentapeptide) pyrophosphoryl-undecaprenol N-acetylglucosamine transferase